MQGTKSVINHRGVVDDALIKKFRNREYHWDDCQAAFLIHIDQQYGIQSRFEKQPKTFKGLFLTVPMLYRDATAAIAKEDCISNTHPVLQMDNCLLRCLNIARHIEHTLAQKGYHQTVNEPRKIFLKLLMHVKNNQESSNNDVVLKKLEGRFNRECIELLGRYALCNERDQEKTLLQHRYLGSVLSPAFGQLTQIYDAKNKITLEEICFPIIEKTDQQKLECDKGDFQALPEGVKIANMVSASKVKMNDRRLPAQCRESHQETVKNGWVVENYIHFPTGRSEKFSFMRSASLVPLIDLKKTDQNIQSTKENIHQLKLTARRYGLSPNLHLTLLNTRLGGMGTLLTSMVSEKQKEQNVIVDVTRAAASELKTNFTYYPINTVTGMTPAEIDPALDVQKDVGSNYILDKGFRAQNVAHISKIASAKGMTPTFICPSGQDRSAVVSEIYTQLRIEDSYTANHVTVTRQHIEQCRSRAYPNAMLATLAAPGSFGLKSESTPGNYFLPETNALLFCDTTAHTNNTTRIGKKTLPEIDINDPVIEPISPRRRITLSPARSRAVTQGVTVAPAAVESSLAITSNPFETPEVLDVSDEEKADPKITFSRTRAKTDLAPIEVESDFFESLSDIPAFRASPPKQRAVTYHDAKKVDTTSKQRAVTVHTTIKNDFTPKPKAQTHRAPVNKEPLIIPNTYQDAITQINEFIKLYRHTSIYAESLSRLVVDMREKDTHALETLQDVLKVIHDPKEYSDSITRLIQSAKDIHEDRHRTKRRVGIAMLIFGIALLALGISLATYPIANMIVQQELVKAFVSMVEAYHVQIIGGITAAVGLAAGLLSCGLFYSCRHRGAPVALTEIADTAQYKV